MSVSSEQKNEIIEHIYKSSCCRRSLLLGVIFAKGKSEGKRVTISLERAEYAQFVAKLVLEFYGKEPDVFRSSKGGRNIYVGFDSPSAVKYLSEMEQLKEINVNTIIHPRCPSCISAFLRGVFLAAGRLSDPEKQYALEFTLASHGEVYMQMLQQMDLNPRISHKKTGDVIYFRKGEDIESFYGHAGLNKVVFDVIERKIMTLARRETQRYMNCFSKNLNKMTASSERQIAIITQLKEADLLRLLPEELIQTANARLEYPDIPLSSLAVRMSPAVSKSGLSHRLKRIELLGAELLGLAEDK